MAYCRKCGNSVDDTQNFCPKCGEGMQAAAAAPAAPVAPVVAAPAPPPAPYAPAAAPVQAARKSRKGLWIALAVLVVLIAVACVLVFAVFQDQIFGGLTGPEKTVQNVITAIKNKDLDTFFAQLDPQGLQMIAALGMSVDDLKASIQEEFVGYDSMTYSGVKMETELADDGNTAVVNIVEGEVTTVVDGESTVEELAGSADWGEWNLVLRDGKWYLDILSMQ